MSIQPQPMCVYIPMYLKVHGGDTHNEARRQLWVMLLKHPASSFEMQAWSLPSRLDWLDSESQWLPVCTLPELVLQEFILTPNLIYYCVGNQTQDKLSF